MRFSLSSKTGGSTDRRVIAGEEVDLGALGRALWGKRRRIVIPTLVAAALAFVAVNMMTPRYKSEARILLETRENVFLRAEADKNIERSPIDPEAVASQIQVVLSRDLARQVIKRERLAENPEFDPLVGGGSVVRSLLGLVGLGRDLLSMSPEERILEAYYQRLNAFAVEKTRVIAVEFTSSNPDLAARVANAIAEGFLAMQQSTKQAQTRAASDWLENEIASMRKKVAEAESKIEEYRTKSNLYVGSNNSSLPNQQLTEVNSQISAARAQKADLEARAQQLRELLRSGRTIDSSDVANSESMRRLVEQRNVLRAQLAEQSSTLLDRHPRIRELKAQIAEVDVLIRREGERLVRSFENDARVAGNRIETLTASLDQVKTMASKSNEQDLHLRALEREGKAQRELLESYLAKYREASARDNINAAPADARIISHASVPTKPSFPKKLPIVLIVTLATFMLASVLVLTGELLASTHADIPVGGSRGERPAVFSGLMPRGPEPDLTPPPTPTTPGGRRVRFGSAGGRAGGALTEAALAHRQPSGQAAGSSTSEMERAWTIDQIAAEMREIGDAGRRATVVGAMRNVGTTFAAVSLARVLARDAKVVLVDLDFNSPNLSVISNDPEAPGIADLARGTASFGDIIAADRFSSVHLIAAGDVAADAAALAASPILAVTMEALVRTYDHVLIDAGTATDIDAARIAPLAPRAVLVTAHSADRDTRAARNQLLDAGFTDVTVMLGGPQAVAA